MKDLLKALQAQANRNYVELPQEEQNIDWKAIEELEGGRQQQAYVPNSGKSGVTVGAGFDVGQRKNLEGLPEPVKEKLQPVVGLKRDDAERKLAAIGGIELSPEEADLVTNFARNETEQKLKQDWSKVSDVPFESLTPAQKTVLASVAHQYGSLSRTPRFAQFAGKGQWEKVVQELRNFKDQYKTRRNREADYLAQSLKKK